MNLRDYFALEALNSLLRVQNYSDVSKYAERAYKIADSMLEERELYKWLLLSSLSIGENYGRNFKR